LQCVAGFGIGGEYGEGALHIRGQAAGYYNIISGSIGFQLGAQARSVIIMSPATSRGCYRRVRARTPALEEDDLTTYRKLARREDPFGKSNDAESALRPGRFKSAPRTG
jgi:hypothetical protein